MDEREVGERVEAMTVREFLRDSARDYLTLRLLEVRRDVERGVPLPTSPDGITQEEILSGCPGTHVPIPAAAEAQVLLEVEAAGIDPDIRIGDLEPDASRRFWEFHGEFLTNLVNLAVKIEWRRQVVAIREQLVREGELVDSGRRRNGQIVWVHRDFAERQNQSPEGPPQP